MCAKLVKERWEFQIYLLELELQAAQCGCWELNSNPLFFPAEPHSAPIFNTSELMAQHSNIPACCSTDPVPACAQAAPLETGLTGLMRNPRFLAHCSQ